MSRDALIVGINQYQALSQLSAAAKDAEGVAHVLETYSDFRVRRLPEAIAEQRPQVSPSIEVLAEQLQNSLVQLLLPKGNHIPETVFFYFSGHGLQREIGIREGYLATSDTQITTPNSGLSLTWLRRLVRSSPVRQIIIVLDCCHSGEFLSLKDESWQGGEGQSYLFIAASREYEAAYESLQSDYSVLTQALLSGLSPKQFCNGRVTSTDLVATITQQLAHELQQPLFEQGGSEIVLTHQPTYSLPKGDSPSLISRLKQYSFNFCPYRGLSPFEEKHADYYFGREALIQETLHSLNQQNLCALIGASGSGKTSLLRAGIIPRLSVGKDITDSEHWLIRYVQLDKHPLKELAAAFAIANQEITIAQQLTQAEELLRQSDGLANLVTATLLRHPTATKFWLVIDQFESLLIPTTDPETAQAHQQIITALVSELYCQPDVFGIILSLRSDAVDNLTAHNELFSLIKSNQLVMPPMSYQNIRDVIEKPAQKVGLKLDPYLVHNLTLDLTGAPGELALLQMALHELWQHRTTATQASGSNCLSLESYMKLGRLPTLLINRAAALYEALPTDEQLAMQRILLALCNLGEGRLDHGRQVCKLELVNAQYPENLIERVLQKLIVARLVVVNKPLAVPSPPVEGRAITAAWKTHVQGSTDIKRWLATHWTPTTTELETKIDLAHQSLVSDWPLFRQWLQPRRSLIRQGRDIEKRAEIWHHHGEPKCCDYLLSQPYLDNISQFLQVYFPELSTVAQHFIQTSRRSAAYQRWRSRGVAGLLPLAMITGMTVTLVRHQHTTPWRVQPLSNSNTKTAVHSLQTDIASTELPVQSLLPHRWGTVGTEQLAITAQTLMFRRNHP